MFPGVFGAPMVSASMISRSKMRSRMIRVKRSETALLSAFTARLRATHGKLLPLAYDGICEFLLSASSLSLSGLKLQVDVRKQLLQLLVGGFANPLVKMTVH